MSRRDRELYNLCKDYFEYTIVSETEFYDVIVRNLMILARNVTSRHKYDMRAQRKLASVEIVAKGHNVDIIIGHMKKFSLVLTPVKKKLKVKNMEDRV